MKTLVRALFGLLLCVTSVSGTAGQNGEDNPRLILVLSIDQMRFDYLTRFDDLYTGGLRTLLDRGAIMTDAKYRHASTETGPGHATLISGRHPSSSGIIANDWWDRLLHKVVNVVDDPFQRPLGGAGRSASPVHFSGFTIGDVLKQNSPRSKVVGVSTKDRSAILMAGRLGDAAYWFERAEGNFITSTYYMDEAPGWLDRWNRGRMADSFAGTSWNRLVDDESLYQEYAGEDAVVGEWTAQDTEFPHPIPGNPPEPDYYRYVRRSPFADEMVLSVALEAVRAHDIGEDQFTDILALGFSGTDLVGHEFGPASQELMDQLLRLDRILGELFEQIDRRNGLDQTLVVLTADHGVLPLVETLKAQGTDAGRGTPESQRNAVERALRAKYPGATGLIAYFGDRDIYLNQESIRDHGLERGDVEATIISALRSTGLVAAVYTREQLVGSKSVSDPYINLFRNSFESTRSPDLIIRHNENVYIDADPGGTGHGTPYDYDRHVPIVFMGNAIEPGWYFEACGPEDIAPTLALLLGMEYPRESDSRLLLEILK